MLVGPIPPAGGSLTPVAGPRSHQQFPLLDSLRGLAALSILVVHVAIISGVTSHDVYGRFVAHLDIGVPFFFLLSAFLLYRPFVAARVEGMPRTEFGEYAKRRFVRIMPAYWFALTVAAIVPGFTGAFTGEWWAYYGLLQSYPIHTPATECVFNPYECGIPVAWSLTVEVGFYIALPFLVLGMAWIGKRFRNIPWLRLELAVIGVIALVSIALMSRTPDTDLEIYLFFSPIGRGLWFALGLLLAAVSVWAVQRQREGSEPRFVGTIRKHPGPFVLAAIALYVLSTYLMNDSALAFPVNGQGEFLAQFILVGFIAALTLLPAVFGSEGGGLFRSALAHPVLTWLGLISYGVFLWQFPVMIALTDIGLIDGIVGTTRAFGLLLVGTTAGSIACAAFSFYLLERPLMDWARGRRPSIRRERTAT